MNQLQVIVTVVAACAALILLTLVFVPVQRKRRKCKSKAKCKICCGHKQQTGAPQTSRQNLRALIVVTSHSDLGDTGKKTGYYLPEVTHPYFALTEQGIDVDFVSPQGGDAPMDDASFNLNDEVNQRFVRSPGLHVLSHTLRAADVSDKPYSAIIFAGGHGTMWDFPDDTDLQRLARAIYEKGGVVAAVCHGPAALVNLRLSNGQYLVEGQAVTAFSNREELHMALDDVVPFALETALVERGAQYSEGAMWAEHVIVSNRLVTGQNPNSAALLGVQVAKLLLNQAG